MCILIKGIREQKDSYCSSLNCNLGFEKKNVSKNYQPLRLKLWNTILKKYSATQSLRIAFIRMKSFQASFGDYSSSKVRRECLLRHWQWQTPLTASALAPREDKVGRCSSTGPISCRTTCQKDVLYFPIALCSKIK